MSSTDSTLDAAAITTIERTAMEEEREECALLVEKWAALYREVDPRLVQSLLDVAESIRNRRSVG